jgi:hypothetical protein
MCILFPQTAKTHAPAAGACSVVVDDFESGALAGWTTKNALRGSWMVYSNGQAAPDPTKSDARVPFAMPNPPQGKFAAASDTNGPGTRILYRDVALDGRYILHATVFYVSAGKLISPPALDHTVGPNQQYRVDVVDPAAAPETTSADTVFANVFQTAPDGPDRIDPKDVTADLSRWAGKTVRLRLASVDNRGPLRAGVDNICLERVTQ